jgi:predicted  nucleic acid-binding Zn-ribbon protein
MHELKSITKDVTTLTDSLREVRPKLEAVTQMELAIKAAHKRMDAQQKTIDGLRERSHELAGWITSMRARMEGVGEKFTTQWVLPNMPKDEE